MKSPLRPVTRVARCSVEDVVAVLRDGWLYGLWVTGASRIRDVDDTWPAEGSELHHSAGVWPLVLDDTTTVLDEDLPERLVLDARGWPFGRARVELHLRAVPTGCLMTLHEDVSDGPGFLVPAPVRGLAMTIRNRECLNRLEMLARGRRHHH